MQNHWKKTVSIFLTASLLLGHQFPVYADVQTEQTTPGGQTEQTTPDGQTEQTTPDGQTEQTAPDGQTEQTAPDGQTEQTAPDGQTGQTTPDGQTEQTAPDGQTGQDTPDGQTQQDTAPTLPPDVADALRDEGLDPQELDARFVGELQRSGAITVSTSGQFVAAIANRNSPITVDAYITIGEEAEQNGRMKPFMIPAGTEITGTRPTGDGLNFRCPIQLEGDVTFRGMQLNFSSSTALGSVPHREIFLNGHHLTLENVDTYLAGGSMGGFTGSEDELLPSVYGGSYPGKSGSGSRAGLTVRGSETKFKDVYMGHDANQVQDGAIAYTGEATVELDSRTVVRGGIHVEQNSSAQVTIKGETKNTSISSGLSQLFANEKTTLIFDQVTASGLDIGTVGKVELKNEATFFPEANTLPAIDVPSGCTLALNRLGSVTIGGAFSGDGTVWLQDENGSLTVNGDISGTKTLAIKSENNTAGLPRSGKTYVTAQGATGSEFQLDASHTGYTLAFTSPSWVINKEFSSKTEPKSLKVHLKNPTADLSKLDDGTGESKEAPIDLIWYDENGDRIPAKTSSNDGHFYQRLVVVKKDTFDSADESKIECTTNIFLVSEADIDSSTTYTDTYYIQAQDVDPGTWTLYFTSEEPSLDLDNPENGAAVKEFLQDAVLAQTDITLFRSNSSPDTPATDIASADVTVEAIAPQTYTGKPIEPQIIVKHGAKTLTKGTDYLLAYQNNVNKGIATVEIIGQGSYTGKKAVTYEIVQSESTAALTAKNQTAPSSSTFTYGDVIELTLQAQPKAGRRSRRSASENTVEFLCNGQSLGTATIDDNNRATLTYRTTDRKIPAGEPVTITAEFGGSSNLAGSSASMQLTLQKKTVEVASVRLQDFDYNGKKQASIVYATLKDASGTELSVSGTAELPKAEPGSYDKATVTQWAITGKDAAWMALPAAPAKDMAVSPSVRVLPKKAPTVSDLSDLARPGQTHTVNIREKLPAELRDTAVITLKSGYTPDQAVITAASVTDGTLSYTTAQAADKKTAEIPVTITVENMEPINITVHVTVTAKTQAALGLKAPSREYNGKAYNEASTTVSGVKPTLTYYDLDQKIELSSAPTNAGHYQVTAKLDTADQIGEETVAFEITKKELRLTAKDKTIQTGTKAPDLSSPKSGTDYDFDAGYAPLPQDKDQLGHIQMAYDTRLDENKPAKGSYDILISIPNFVNHNYALTVKKGTLTVEGEAPSQKHSVTVEDGTADPAMAASGTTVNIQATVPAGKRFVRWQVVSGGVTLDNEAQARTHFTMGNQDVEIKAIFAQEHSVTVEGGTADPKKAIQGDIVTITATIPDGQQFVKWEVVSGGVTLDKANQAETSFTMGDQDVVLRASFEPIPPNQHAIVVHGGSTSHNAAASGTTVTITATVPTGKRFVRWEVVSGGVRLDNEAQAETTFTMGDQDVELRAILERDPSVVVPVQSVTLDRSQLSLYVGDSAVLHAQLNPADATDQQLHWSSDGLAVRVDDSGTVTGLVPGTATVTVRTNDGNHTAQCTVTVSERSGSSRPSDDDDDDDDDRPSRPSGSSRPSSGAGDKTTSNVGKDGSVKASDVQKQVKNTIASGSKHARILVENAKTVSPEVLRAMADTAAKQGGQAALMADTVVNGVTEGRIWLDTGRAASLKQELRLGLRTTSPAAKSVKKLFSKFYRNNVRVVSMEQKDGFGMVVRVAAKLDWDGMDRSKLVFYRYDRVTNKYSKLPNTAYTVDAHGFVHFNTAVGGDILVSSGALTVK